MQSSDFRQRSLLLATIAAAALAACGGGGGSSSSVTPTTAATPGSAPAAPSFSTIAGAPASISAAASPIPVPTVPGVNSVGGSVNVSGSGSASLLVAPATAAGSSAGPPTALRVGGMRKASVQPNDSSGSTITPVYYIGITNTTSTAEQVSFTTMTLSVPALTTGWAYALACYDPSDTQDGWNQDCAFGSNVSVNGTSATFTLNQTFTIYPGVTLWFAPYAYQVTMASPTPEPKRTPVPPTPPPAPSSLTGTYVGEANGQSDDQYLEVSLTQAAGTNNVTGIYALVPNEKDNGSFGTLSGTVSGGTLTLTATQQFGGNCGSGTITATVSGILVNGTFTPATSSTCSGGGGGTFSIALQTSITSTISGNFTGTVNDSVNGAGTLTLQITEPGSVFSGNAAVTWNSGAPSGTGALVGFFVNSTTAQFALITDGACGPNGTITISGTTLTGTYGGSGDGTSGCSGTGTFTLTQQP